MIISKGDTLEETFMKLLKILTEATKNSFEFKELTDKIKAQGGKFVGGRDYGNAYKLGDKIVKATTDEVELEHAEILKGKNTKNIVHIFDVDILGPKLGVVYMENLDELSPNDQISEDFLEELIDELESLGIDPDELDIEGPSGSVKRDNFMKDPKTGRIKMIDV